MIVPNTSIDLPANTTSFDAFDSVITSLGAFQGKIFEAQVSTNVILDGVTILGGRKFCQIIRHSGTDHAAVYMFGWAGQDDRYFLTKTGGTWSCSKLPSRREITALNNSLATVSLASIGGGYSSIPDNDFNSVTYNLVCRYANDTSYAVQNAPSFNYGTLFSCIPTIGGNAYGFQMVVSSQNSQIAIRSYVKNSGFTAWKYITPSAS